MKKVIDPTDVAARAVPVRSLGEARRTFLSHVAPRMVVAAIVLAWGLRAFVGQWSLRDLAVVVTVAVVSPFTEWLIHRFFLHLKPVPWKGKRVEISSARRHRHHHQSPGLLREVLLKPVEISVFLPMIAINMTLLALPTFLIFGGAFVPLWITAAATAYVLLGLYEWTHLLIHTQYVPKSAIYKSCYRSHRLHHFRNENYWLGVTTNIADRFLGTNPRKDEVPISATATTLAA